MSELEIESDAAIDAHFKVGKEPLAIEAAVVSIAISLKRIADVIEGSPHRLGLVEHLGRAIQDAIYNARNT